MTSPLSSTVRVADALRFLPSPSHLSTLCSDSPALRGKQEVPIILQSHLDVPSGLNCTWKPLRFSACFRRRPSVDSGTDTRLHPPPIHSDTSSLPALVMKSPSKPNRRPSRAERAMNRGSAYSSGSDTSTDGSRSTETDMGPPTKRPRHQRTAAGNAEHDSSAHRFDLPSGGTDITLGLVKRAPPPRKTYGKGLQSSPVDGALPQVSSVTPIDEIFASTKDLSLPARKAALFVPFTATAPSTETTPLASPLSSSPSAQSSRSSTPLPHAPPAPPTITVHPASPAPNVPPIPLAPLVRPENVPTPLLAPPAVSTRNGWSRRKLDSKPGLRVIGKMSAVITRKPTAAEKLAAATAAAKKEEKEAVKVAERLNRISLTGQLCFLIHLSCSADTCLASHQSSFTTIHSPPSRSPTRLLASPFIPPAPSAQPLALPFSTPSTTPTRAYSASNSLPTQSPFPTRSPRPIWKRSRRRGLNGCWKSAMGRQVGGCSVR